MSENDKVDGFGWGVALALIVFAIMALAYSVGRDAQCGDLGGRRMPGTRHCIVPGISLDSAIARHERAHRRVLGLDTTPVSPRSIDP